MAPNDRRKKRKKRPGDAIGGQKRQVHGTAPTVIGYEGSLPEEGPGLTIFAHVKRSAEKFATARRVFDGETLMQGVHLTGIPDLLPEIFQCRHSPEKKGLRMGHLIHRQALLAQTATGD
ncbi:hypothetical protein [Methanoculleus sp.]|uniref:hypothetical protein n=1 Tax=Methanoculleus sp. TaxID=90427 RepID=UPI0026033451|nr:hypothetical protein [Methanoculleus sp.]MDI6867233.1 hypothetical protein [Methanoculleus sp.]